MCGDIFLAITEDDLHAFVDGMLEPIHAAGIGASLFAHPRKAARAQAYRQQNAGLNALYGAVVDEPIPAGIAALIERARAASQLRQTG
jgi:anti-sigma factor RsiW